MYIGNELANTFFIAEFCIRLLSINSNLKDRVHCFSMQVVMNECFLLNPEKKFGADPFCRFREKRKKRTFNSEK